MGSLETNSFLEDLIPHVFLPLQVSSKSVVDIESLLLHQVTDAIDHVAFDLDPGSLKKLKNTFRQWESLQNQENMDAKDINNAIIELEPGDDFALYIRDQNAGLLISILDNKNQNVNGLTNGGDNLEEPPTVNRTAVFSTFPACQPMKLVTSAEGDLASIYPTTSITVTSSAVLKSECFALQLSTLNNNKAREAAPFVIKSEQATTEVREVPSPILVAQWLSALLVDENSRQSTKNEMPRIVKKIRDRVVYDKGGTIPFRRSGLWHTIKVVLQLCLVRQFGDVDGNFLYKLIIFKVMVNLTQHMNLDVDSNTARSAAMHGIGKIARRTMKLQIYANSKKVRKVLLQVFADLSGESAKVLHKIRASLKDQWDDFIKHEMAKCTVPTVTGKLDTCHSLKHNGLLEYLSSSRTARYKNVLRINVPEPYVPQRHCLDHEKFPRKMFFDCREDWEHLGTTLFDFESNVFCWENFITLADFDYVWDVFQDYVKVARKYYAHDSVGLSRMILTCLKMVKEWDSVVTDEYPMLKEHRPGIDLGFTGFLVLPERTAMHQLLVLENYFKQREKTAKFPSLIEEEQMSAHSFPVRHAKVDISMQHTKERILDLSKRMQVEILCRVQTKRQECEKLQTEIRSLECEYKYSEWKRYHSRECKKCQLIQKEKKCVVSVYEKPLPINEESQDAVMFELMAPRSILCLRDLLYLFGVSVTGYVVIDDEKELYGPWSTYVQLINFNQNRHCKPTVVSLMSSSKLFLESHYRCHHATNPDCDFIVNNGFNLRLAGNSKPFQHTKPTGKKNYVRVHCAFKVQKRSPYSTLQWAVNGGETTHNQVLARQNECHRDLSLAEFVEFGSLRASCQLQLRNLYRALTQMTVSLKTESVFSLVSQTLWETGPNTAGNLYRDAHQEYQNDVFLLEFLELAENRRKKHAHNWKDHYVLLTIIIFALRTVSLTNNKEVLNVAFLLLDRCREMAMKWSGEIRKLQASNFDAPRSEIDALRLKMIEVNACCALTFSVDPHHYSRLDSHATLLNWLLAIANIYDNSVLLGSGHATQMTAHRELPRTLQNLLRRVHEAGLNLEPFLHQKLQRSALVLNSFVEVYNNDPHFFELDEVHPSFIVWSPYKTAENIYYCELFPRTVASSKVMVLQLDIVGGSFLVDGCPVSYLPSTIENHPEFQRVFPMRSFEVKPYAFQQGRFITRDPYCNSYYSFFLMDNQSLVITEHRPMNVTLELLPSKMMAGNIPHLLMDGCSHWWNKDADVVEFFKRDDTKAYKLYHNKPRFMLYLGGLQTFVADLAFRPASTGSQRQRILVDISCAPYAKIVDIVRRLEYVKYVNIWYQEVGDKKKHIVELPRMGLQFELYIRRSCPVLMSIEYRGMKVADKQMLDTLVGLKNGLLLEDANVNSTAKMPSLLLMPHGETTVKGSHNLEIQTKQLRTPAFFAYEVDERLRQLRARESQSAWLFLAFLHAATSSSLPDPFTQVTGTERALEILQSGHCWSGQPLDEECLTTLNDISMLAPVRQYYPPALKTMETVKWKISMPGDRLVSLTPQVAHDAFQLVAQKLLRDSERLNFLFPRNTSADWKTAEERQESVAFDSDNELCVKAYWQRVGLSTKEGRISADFDEAFDLKNAPAVTPIATNSAFDITFSGERMIRTLRISQLAQKWTYNPPSSASKLVQCLLLTPEDLKGVLVGDGDGYQKNEDWRSWSEMSFRDNWLDLYNFARKAERVGMQMEWTHLLTMLAFRVQNPVPFDHLLLLHTIAVNPYEFLDLNPPPHIEYFVANEFTFYSETISDILRTCIMPWNLYMDHRAAEMKEKETLPEFIDRMRPEYDNAAEEEITSLTRDLQLFWPTSNCEKVPSFDREFDPSDIILIEEAKKNVNATLKNWYNNMELHNFLRDVEARAESLKVSNNKQFDVKDLGKQLFRPGSSQPISQYFKREMMTINLEDILMKRDCADLDYNFMEQMIHLFDNEGKIPRDCAEVESPSSSKILSTNADASFPLQTTSTCPILNTYMTELRESWSSMERAQQPLYIYNTGLQSHEWAERLRANRVKAQEMWERIKRLVKPIGTECDNVTRALISAELFPRVTPLTMLPLICKKFQHPYLKYIKNLLGIYGVLVTWEQRSARCFRYTGKEKKGKERTEFQRELELERENPGHENWNPAKQPHWLLFEIEMDIMIRKIQAKVAERMENPMRDKNALLQLNMGEGKTAVIVPLLILSLANGSQLCRVTVLKSLYEINQKALISTLGGLLLNRRVYTFPCRRDFALGQSEVGTLFEVYQECLVKCGVVMTLPEYRLSFQLKMYEKCGAENFVDGREFLNMQQWLDTHARDVLDESDEILHVKYQLIYTIGKQQSIGGGSTRWVVLQKLLKLVPEHLRALKWQFENSIEVTERPEPQFPFCRLLKPDCSEKLCTRLAADVINGHTGIRIPPLRAIKREIVMQFLTNPIIDRDTINKTYEYFPLEVHREILLTLRGLLACGVLNTALTKRWRVNYGVNPSGYRRVAVPFRAKDVAAERTEFGHPDIAIILTQLSYYYSGLSDDEIHQSFMLLFKQPDPNAEYNLWMSSVPTSLEGFEAIKMLSGVNLKDFYQRTQILFPAFRFNTATIDFWLSNVVFPQESKQFAWKIGCSPWDLSAETEKPTTGFSGTNESKLLLPKTITQNDLPELLGTNGSVLRNLLKSDNNKYEALNAGFSGKDILEKLVTERIRILLDVGALMLELDNEQVAQAWLELEDEDYIDAAVYFDVNNKLVVTDRTLMKPVSLELSTYRTRLDRCVIYLDDVHTRGTDLKIPPSSKGCVTLGKGVTKDKLVQGCMRMRKLGHGHTVVFWASNEVGGAIKSMVPPEHHPTIGSKEVLQWTIENSRAAIEDGFMHWANAGVYQAQKLSSHYLFNCSKKTDLDLKLLADSCSLKETTDLKIMYGEVKSFQPFPVLVQFLLKRVKREMEKRLKKYGKEIQHNVEGIVSSFGEAVVTHTTKYVSGVIRSSQMGDEEQERELEHELEAEQEKELPPKYKPNPHSIHPSVQNFVLNGELHGIENWAVKLPLALYRTTLWKLCKVDTWGQHIYATHEFQNVIKSELKSDVLRPVQWFLSLAQDDATSWDQRSKDRRTVVLLISPFEASYFIDFIRGGRATVFLHMYASRLSPEEDTLCNNPRLLLPVTSSPKPDILTPNMNASLLLFSGSSYFSCKEEQDEYCQIVGFCLQDRNEAERKVYEDGGIQDGFFVKPEFRARVGITRCQFQENPEALIREIIRSRFGNFSSDSHVGKMIHLCRKPFAE